MEIATIPAKDLRHTRVAQEWIEEGRQEGEARGRSAEAVAVTLRLLNRRCGPLSEATTARIQALLDFTGPADLAALGSCSGSAGCSAGTLGRFGESTEAPLLRFAHDGGMSAERSGYGDGVSKSPTTARFGTRPLAA